MAKHPKGKDELNDQQEIFCREYIKDLNGKQAAVRAGYSEHTAQEQSSRLLSNVKVKRRVQELLDELIDQLDISNALILRGILDLATADPADAYDENGNPLPIHLMPKKVRMALTSFDVFEEREDGKVIGETKKYKLADKRGAWELLGKYKALFTQKIEVTGKVTLEDLVADEGED